MCAMDEIDVKLAAISAGIERLDKTARSLQVMLEAILRNTPVLRRPDAIVIDGTCEAVDGEGVDGAA
jgi:hypothetical protein